MFLLGSQHVPNSTLLYPISLAFSSDLVTKITRSKQEHYNISALGMFHFLYFLGFCDVPINDATHQKNKRNFGDTHNQVPNQHQSHYYTESTH
jgi:hypothetical protein